MGIYTGTAGNDTIIPGTVSAGVFRFPFFSTPGAADDTIYGGAGHDNLDGGGGVNTIYGGDGADTLRSSGRGLYDGGAGNDYIYAGSGTPETLRGGSGLDWLNTTHWGLNYTINLTTGATNYAGESFTEFENLVAGAGADTITGTSGANFLYGGDGGDTIDGLGGDDIISGGSGADILRGGGGTDSVYGGADNDTLYSSGYGTYDGGLGDDYVYAASGTPETLRGGAGVDWLNTTHWGFDYTINLTTGATNYAGESFTEFEHLVAGAGADIITGTSGANFLYGGDGADTIDGLGGDDIISGGNGNDTLRGGGGTDVVYGGADNDTIYSSGFGTYDGGAGNDAFFAAAGLPETLRGGDGIDSLNTTHWAFDYTINLTTGATNYAGESFVQFENLIAGAGSDTLTGTSGGNIIYGGGGDDEVDGLGGDDLIYGGGGADTLRGGGGTDLVFGGDDNDTLYSSGTGAFDGGAGNDYIYAATGLPETLRGGTGTDWLNTTHWGFDYTINLGTGVTNYAGESFIEFEHLVAGAGSDTITGTAGGNAIYGNDGADTIFGLAGNDVLSGGAGADLLYGGGGSDRFDFDFASASGLANIDRIIGFDGAGFNIGVPEDRIDVSGIDAITGVLGNQAFTFWGEQTDAQGLARGAGALWVNNAGAETRVRANIDADNTIEVTIRIADGGGVVAGDYWAGDFIA